TGPAPPRRSVRAPGTMSHHRNADQPGKGDLTMSFNRWLRSFQSALAPGREERDPRRRQSGRGRATRRLVLEQLEDRSLPSCMVSLAPNEAAPQLVGEGITWTATPTDCGATPVYQFSVAPDGGAFRVVRDFSPTNASAWTPVQ